MSRPPGELLKWTEPDRDGPRIDRLVAALAALDGRVDDAGIWPAALWSLIEKEGATRWSLPQFAGRGMPAPASGAAIRPARNRQSYRRVHPVPA